MADTHKYVMFQNRLEKVYRHLSKTARKQHISCFRIYDHDLPEFPFFIDLYEDHLYISEYQRKHKMSEEAHEDWMQQCLRIASATVNIPLEHIFTKTRRRKQGRQGQYQKTATTQHEFIVHEHGLKFLINLSDYLDTGLFLDHRITRKMVQGESNNKRILNLFAYTGSFSVYAAAGGAKKVTTVDLSKTYLNWAERNLLLNGFNGPHYEMVHADVLQYLKTLPADSYDLIVMDPPTFSNSQRMHNPLDIQRDHVALINDCLTALAPGGVLYFSTNFTKFNLKTHQIHCDNILDITKATTPFDFAGKLQRGCYKFFK